MPDPKIMRSSESVLPIQYCSELKKNDKNTKDSEDSEEDEEDD